jgi:hypothetical protein
MFPELPRGTEMQDRKQAPQVIAIDDEAGCRLLDEWLRIERESTDPGFLLPDRDTLVTWTENHAAAVLTCASVVVWAPVIGAICFG